jgi:hypothetical protein
MNSATRSQARRNRRAAPLLALGLLAAAALPAFSQELKFLEDPGEGDFDVTGNLKVTEATPAARLAFNWQDSKDHYLLTIQDGQAKLAAVVGGKAYALGVATAVKPAKGQSVAFTLQRRDWRMALVWGNRVVLRAYDVRLKDGKVGYAAQGASWEDLRVQPVGDIVVHDDFVREAGAQSVWEPQCGTWQSKTLRDDEQAAREEADKSANAFSYFGTGVPRAITVAGNWFWDRYALEASVKAQGSGAAGLVFYYQNDKNYLLLRFTERNGTAADANRLQLVLVEKDKPTVLAEKPSGYLREQWYKLRIEACEDQIVVLLDGEPQLRAKTDRFGQGQVGLYAEGKDGIFFDDVVCDAWDMLAEDFAVPVPGKWAVSKGWVQKGRKLISTSPQPSLARLEGRWDSYACEAEATSQGGGAGLVFAYEGPADYCLLRWVPAAAKCGFRGKTQLLHVGAKGPEVLAERAAPAGVSRARLRATVNGDLLTGTVGSSATLQAVRPGVKGGTIGLYAEGKVAFEDLSISPVSARRGSHVTKEFSEVDKHPEMAEWASNRAPWIQPTRGQNLWWSKGDYYGDTSLSFVVPAVGSRTGSARAVLGAEPGKEKDALALTLSATSGAKKVSLAVSLGEKLLGTAEATVERDATVAFSREGRLVVVKVNDAVALTTTY